MSSPASTIVATDARPVGPDRPPLDCRLGADGIVAVLGPRACRHACMRLLAGADRPVAGSVSLLGHAIEDLDAATALRLRQRIGYVAPYLRLLSVLSGWANVLLAARYHAVADETTLEARARELIEPLRDAGEPGELPAYMSQLQQMHLSTARALMLEPDFLFAEDPFRGLEADERNRLANYLAEVAPRHASCIVIATDDTAFARDYANRIVVFSPQGHGDFTDWTSLLASGMAGFEAPRSPADAASEGEP